jgi:hypothetical protein
MSALLEIPVLANSVGDCVRVRIATTLDCSEPPEPRSRLWRIVRDIPNEDLPMTIETPARPLGTCVWYTAAAYENGVRVSNYADAQVKQIPLDPNTLEVTLEP